MLHLLRLLSVRHLFGHPLRSALTVFGVAVGVATMVGIFAINRAVMDAFRSTIDVVAGKADLTVAGARNGFPEDVLEKVRQVPGVAHASGGLTQVVPVKDAPGESLFVMGVDLLDDGHFRSYRGKDRDVGALSDDLEFLNSTDRMMVSERFAKDHGLKTGDRFTLLSHDGAKEFVIHGLLEESGPIKAFGGWVGLMFVASAQEAFGRGAVLDRIEVAAAPGTKVEDLEAALERELGPAFEVARPEMRGGSVETMVRSFQMALNMGSAVALLVGIFLVYNTVSIGVVQRRREIGTLRALGATRLGVRTLFSLEGLLFGLLGSAVGVPLGVAIARAAVGAVSDTVSSIYVQVNARDVKIVGADLVLGVGLGLAGTLFAALRPAVLASGVQPVEALRRDVALGAGEVSLRSPPVALGALLVLLAWPLSKIPPPVENLSLGGYLSIFAALMGVTLLSPLALQLLQRLYQRPAEAVAGIAGRLAADNFARAPMRTAVPVSALVVGVSMTVCMAGFIGSFQASGDRWITQSIPADLFVTSAARLGGIVNNPVKPGLGDELLTVPGVDYIDRVRLLQHDILGLRGFVISLVPEVYDRRGKPDVIEGRPPTPEERARGFVTVSENLARRRDLHPGSRFVLQTPTGPRELTVACVIIDYTSDQGSVILDRRYFVEWFQDDLVDTFHVYVKDPAQIEAVRKEITARWGKALDLYVLSNRELRAEATALIDNAFSVTYAMEAVAVLLALLGVINTLLAAVIDRTREIGLLRAVGASRSHVVRLIAVEATLMGVTGGLIGTVLGTILGVIVTEVVGVQATGWHFQYLVPWQTALQMVLTAGLCALLAGLYPARRASRLDVVEALAYE